MGRVFDQGDVEGSGLRDAARAVAWPGAGRRDLGRASGWRAALLLMAAAAAALLAGCASTQDPSLKPAALKEIRSPIPVRVVWRLSLGSAREEFLQPAVVENAIFAASADGTVTRVAPDTGREVWRTSIGGPIAAGVGSDGFMAAVATPRGEVVALGGDGKVMWRAPVSSDVTAPPLVGRGLVVVRSTDHRVIAFESDTGKRRWQVQRTPPPLTVRGPTQMAFAGELLLVGLPGGRLVGVSLANGAIRWDTAVADPRGSTEVERLADVVGAPVVQGRDVCAAAFQSRVACVDAVNGTLRWTREVAAATGVAVDERQVYAVDMRSSVHALARETGGASVWKSEELRARKLGAPMAVSRALVAGDFEGQVHFLSLRDGAVIARVATDGGPIVVAPQRWGEAVVVQTTRGTLMLLQPGS